MGPKTAGGRLMLLVALLALSHHALLASGLDFHGMEDNCILSFVVPRDKVKSSCDMEERVTRRLNAMETKVALYKQHMVELQEQLNKERQLNNERLQQITEQLNTQAKPDDLVHKRILALEEEVRKLRGTSSSSSSSSSASFSSSSSFQKDVISNSLRDPGSSDGIVVTGRTLDDQRALHNLVRSVVHSEVKVLFDNYTQYVGRYVRDQATAFYQVISLLPRPISKASTRKPDGERGGFPAQGHPATTEAVAPQAESTRNVVLHQEVTRILEQVNSTGRQITEQVEIIFRNITSRPIPLDTMALGENDGSMGAAPEVTDITSGDVNDTVSDLNVTFTFTDEQRSTNIDSLKHTTQTNVHVPTAEVIVKEVAKARMTHNAGGEQNMDSLAATSSQHSEQKTSRNQSVLDEGMLHDQNQQQQKLHEVLKTEIQRILQQKMDEMLDLLSKRSALVESRLDDHQNRLQQLQQHTTDNIRQLDQTVKHLQLEMTSTSQGVQSLFARTDGLSELQETVKDLKKNTTVEGGGRYLEALIDENGKRVRKLERLTAVYQQSMEHYRNETKTYRELMERLNKEANAMKLLNQALHDNVTSQVQQVASHLNASVKHAVDDVRQRVQVMEDNSLLLQIDVSSFERQLKSKTSKLEDSVNKLEGELGDVKQKTRNLQRSLGGVESTQDHLLAAVNATSKEMTSLKMEVKLNVLNDWLPYNFEYTKSRTDCFGDQYVRRSSFKTGRLVGVVLCTRDRYKIFLGQGLTDTFKNIGDDHGMGEDHCQFVGAPEMSKTKVSPLTASMETEQGYVRANWGEEPRPELINFIRPSPLWYECGVSIP